MNPQQEDEQIETYLLGALTPADRDRVESRYFSDPAYLDRMDLIEEELLDQYMLGTLDERRKLCVEEHLLTSQIQKQKAKFSASFLSSIVELAPSDQPGSGREYWTKFLQSMSSSQNLLLLCLAFGLLVLFAGIWLMRFHLTFGSELEERGNQPLQAEGERRNGVNGEPALPAAPYNPVVQTILLTPTLYTPNEETTRELSVTPATELIELQLFYDGQGYESYSIVLETPEGETRSFESDAKPSSRFKENQTIKFVLRASVLQSGSYNLLLRGAMPSAQPENLRRYAFRVIQK